MADSKLRRVAVVAIMGAFALTGAGEQVASGAALMESRSYELVSPPDKNGGDALPVPSRTRAAADGDAVAFGSLTAFGDALGTGVTSEYISRRDGHPQGNGWSTHAIMPKLDPFSASTVSVAGFSSTYLGEFSDDLAFGILRTGTNLSGDPNLGTVANLYLRGDLLMPGVGSYSTVTLCPVCVSPFTQQQQPDYASLADATPDFGHVLFETRLNLVAEASGTARKVYEWDHGEVRLAGILPAAMGGGMAPTSIAGTGAMAGNYTLRTLSDDGRRIVFTDNSSTGNQTGILYMRIDHTTTVRLNASERTDCATQDPCAGTAQPDPGGVKPARFQTASADGTKVVLSSAEALTDDDSRGLYVYDSSLPDSDPHNLRLIAAGQVRGVIGASSDAGYVYFLADEQLVAGGPPVSNGNAGVYVWHAGALRYIGLLTKPGQGETENVVGNPYGLVPLGSRVTPDGLHLVFTSHSGEGLTGYDQSAGCGIQGCAELYLYSYEQDALACVSCNPSGAPATGDAGFTQQTGNGASQATSHLSHALSDDGRYVFFTSGERLVAEDRNGAKCDAYGYDSVTGSIFLLSSGRSGDDSIFLDASADGRDAFFATRERLVGWDVDAGYDIYDARVGGGFPEPPPANGECTGDACQGPASGVPEALTSLSSTFVAGSDNVKRAGKAKSKPRRCKKGKVRKRVHGKTRCVKRKHSVHRKAGGTR